MSKKFAAILVCFILFFLAPALSFAGDFRLRWVEADVILDKDGKAQISYTVRWACRDANLHGFYFEGFTGVPYFDYKNSFAEGQDGTRYNLDIKQLSSRKFDVVLSDGRAFNNGEITYFLRLSTDLQESGNLTQTDSKFGRLAVFNWAPVQWNERLEHETVTVHYPIEVPFESVSKEFLENINFRTEKYVNERYLINYTIVKGYNGNNLFTLKFHRNNLSSRYHFQIQTYVDASYFNLSTIAPSGAFGSAQGFKKAKEPYVLNRFFPGSILAELPIGFSPLLFIALFALGFVLLPLFIMTRKHVSMLAAQDGISRVKWEGDEWVPPKIQIGSFRQKGKVCKNLTALEAGLLLDFPLSFLVGLMVQNMERKGLVKIMSLNPLRVERTTHQAINNITDAYEFILFNAIHQDGSIGVTPLHDMFYTIAKGMEQKAWDCDLEATKNYYRSRMGNLANSSNQDESYYWDGYYYHDHGRCQNHSHDNYKRSNEISKNFGQDISSLQQDFSSFRTSPMCYDGPFLQNVCHGACHGACVSSGH